ncbi:MAG: hypothetical protein F6K48_28160 [Okeania sp. SIO3H1]|nr:hypothetical protein [Okeania sp. SIO3H1]NET30326.1 hypothetical protein [Okeania sp. SIO1I7]
MKVACAWADLRYPNAILPGLLLKKHEFVDASKPLIIGLVRSRSGICYYTPFVYPVESLPPEFRDFDWSEFDKFKDLPIDYVPPDFDQCPEEF